MKLSLKKSLVFVATASVLSAGAQAAVDKERVIVAFKPGNKASVQQAIQKAGGETKVDLPNHHAMAITVPANALKGLKNNPNIEYVEPDVKRKLLASEFEPGQPYGIAQVQADLLSDAAAGNRKVCIIDSGYDLGHPDLQSAGVDGSYNSGTGNWYTDESGHGTHVAGTIAALANGTGVVGVLPNGNINLHIVKVFNADGWGYSSSLIAAADECAAAGSNVINMSLGGDRGSKTEERAFAQFNDQGILSIAAAGNAGNTRHSYPASYDAVVSVAAIDSNKQVASFSQQTNQVELSGPGVAVLSSVPRGMGERSEAVVAEVSFENLAMEGSAKGTATGSLADCGIGDQVCADANGSVCLIERGAISFAEKVQACEVGGGIGTIIYNNEVGVLSGTLGDVVTSIPSVVVSASAGAQMLNQLGSTATVAVESSDWAFFDGTSMATPHVVGVSALVWSHFADCSNTDIRSALSATAEDLGDTGRDNAYGHGLVQAKLAYNYLANNGCSGSDGSGGDTGGSGDDDTKPGNGKGNGKNK
ncbi:S8 family serine peptidase [Idiomarina sp.]|uniref:S8 family serine peptidase n=1 Tax=Idiomarina sp. TaxID=1874361 RepID=UPI0025B8993D|nr:S8 family serine peptidase [Idiomarina sp.]